MYLPSGDQVIGEAGELGGGVPGRLQLPDVSRFASPPLADTTQRCAGMGAEVARKSLLPTSKASLCRSSPLFFTGSSEAEKAIIPPSGRHANCCTPVADFVACSGSPPS